MASYIRDLTIKISSSCVSPIHPRRFIIESGLSGQILKMITTHVLEEFVTMPLIFTLNFFLHIIAITGAIQTWYIEFLTRYIGLLALIKSLLPEIGYLLASWVIQSIISIYTPILTTCLVVGAYVSYIALSTTLILVAFITWSFIIVIPGTAILELIFSHSMESLRFASRIPLSPLLQQPVASRFSKFLMRLRSINHNIWNFEVGWPINERVFQQRIPIMDLTKLRTILDI
ncbi:hypothetical protein F4778DRAFT_596204 [Xylariomycetidae sp. FL2044]|nr:hypothetical protein F4778DRAFT_596204 [Xylariomycetidae sp. FL2044]